MLERVTSHCLALNRIEEKLSFPKWKKGKTKPLQSIVIVRERNKRHSDIFSTVLHALFIWRVYIRSQILRLSRAAILHPSLFPTVCFMINVLKVLCILPRVHINYRLAKAITLLDPLSRLQAPLHRFLLRIPKCLHTIRLSLPSFRELLLLPLKHMYCFPLNK